MILTEEKIAQNREEFLSLINSVAEARGISPQDMTDYFDGTDFFIAPASTKYHSSVKGGLCQHCLNVYYNLKAIVEAKGMTGDELEQSIIVCALLHDMAKVNVYEIGYSNVKVYCDDGNKKDEGGRFKWVVEQSYKTKSRENRFVYGNHEETSEYIARNLIPLTLEEDVAILKHHGGTGWDSTKDGTSEEYCTYPLACMLHVADMLATYIDED